MTEENMLDMKADFEILYSQQENESIMTAWMYELDAIADHITSYYE